MLAAKSKDPNSLDAMAITIMLLDATAAKYRRRLANLDEATKQKLLRGKDIVARKIAEVEAEERAYLLLKKEDTMVQAGTEYPKKGWAAKLETIAEESEEVEG